MPTEGEYTPRRYGDPEPVLNADQTLFQRVQSTKFILVMLVFIVTSAFTWFKVIEPKVYGDVAVWIVWAYVVAEVGSNGVDAFKNRILGLNTNPAPLGVKRVTTVSTQTTQATDSKVN